MIKGKRALSGIVITLILIVLSLVAIGAVWMVVRNIISSSSKQADIGGLTINLDVTQAYEEEGDIKVTVERGNGKGELNQIKFILSNGETSETITKDATLGEFESSVFTLEPTTFLSTAVIEVSIVPIYTAADGTITTGNIAETYTLHSTSTENPEGDENPFCESTCLSLELECGDDGCGNSCGTCTNPEETCTNGICVNPNAPCEAEPAGTTCGVWVCGKKPNNCGIETTCGADCGAGKLCEDGDCISVEFINSGIVEDVWPGDSGLYFGSSSLPTSEETSYQNKFVKFTDSKETDCKLIAIYKLPVEGYSKSHIGFNFGTLIAKDDGYQIFNTQEECDA